MRALSVRKFCRQKKDSIRMYAASKRLICRWFILKNTSATDNTNPSNDADMNNMETGPTSMSAGMQYHELCNKYNIIREHEDVISGNPEGKVPPAVWISRTADLHEVWRYPA